MENQTTGRTPEQELNWLDDKLDEFEKRISLPRIGVVDQAEKYLNLDVSSVKMTPEEFGEAAVTLSRHSLYVQKCCNKETSRILWLDKRIKDIITPRLNQQKGYSYVEKRDSAIREDDVASRLETERVRCEIRAARLSYLASKVEALAEKYMEMSRVIRRGL